MPDDTKSIVLYMVAGAGIALAAFYFFRCTNSTLSMNKMSQEQKQISALEEEAVMQREQIQYLTKKLQTQRPTQNVNSLQHNLQQHPRESDEDIRARQTYFGMY